MGLLPLVSVLEQNGGANVVTTNSVDQLQANNLQFTQVNNESCQFYIESLSTWITSTVRGSQVNDYKRHPSPFVSTFRETMSHSLHLLLTPALVCTIVAYVLVDRAVAMRKPGKLGGQRIGD